MPRPSSASWYAKSPDPASHKRGVAVHCKEAAMNINVFTDPRKPGYLNFDGASRPLKDPIRPETVAKVRAYRHGRIKHKLAEHDCAALLVYDPLNIRYATDCS